MGAPLSTLPSSQTTSINHFRKWGIIALALSIMGWIAYAMIRGFNNTRDEILSASPSLFAVVLGLTLVNYGLRFVKWHYLLNRLGISIPWRLNAKIYCCGLAMVITPAKAGELIKPYLVKEMSGASLSQTIPALIAERATDGIAVILLATLGVSTYYAEGTAWIVGSLLVTLILVITIGLVPIPETVFLTLGKIPVIGNFAKRLHGANTAIRICLSPVPLSTMMVLSLIAWWAECVGYWLVFKAITVDASLDVCTFLYSSATVFGAPSPGGLGIADVALTEGALQLIPALSPAQAIASAVLVRGATLWLGVVIGAIILLRMEALIEEGKRYFPTPPPVDSL